LATLFLSIGLILVVETYSISKQEWLYAPTVVHVVLA